jgi:hypothetical protein
MAKAKTAQKPTAQKSAEKTEEVVPEAPPQLASKSVKGPWQPPTSKGETPTPPAGVAPPDMKLNGEVEDFMKSLPGMDSTPQPEGMLTSEAAAVQKVLAQEARSGQRKLDERVKQEQRDQRALVHNEQVIAQSNIMSEKFESYVLEMAEQILSPYELKMMENGRRRTHHPNLWRMWISKIREAIQHNTWAPFSSKGSTVLDQHLGRDQQLKSQCAICHLPLKTSVVGQVFGCNPASRMFHNGLTLTRPLAELCPEMVEHIKVDPTWTNRAMGIQSLPEDWNEKDWLDESSKELHAQDTHKEEDRQEEVHKAVSEEPAGDAVSA